MRKYETWDDIDADHGQVVSILTYMVLFLNDQCYNLSIGMMEELRKSRLYRLDVKKTANRIEDEIGKYNSHVFRTVKANAYVLADVTQSMEDDILPHIEKLRYAISQALLDSGLGGEANTIASFAETINILAQMSRHTIKSFEDRISEIVPLAYNPLEKLSLDRVEYLSGELANKVCGKVQIDLNVIKSIKVAFRSLDNMLTNQNVYRRALNGEDKPA